jgi:hypothetical protein
LNTDARHPVAPAFREEGQGEGRFDARHPIPLRQSAGERDRMRGQSDVNQLGQLPVEQFRCAQYATHPYDIGASGLIVWPHGAYETEVHFPLEEEPVTHPRPRSVARAAGITPLALNDLVFKRNEIQWVEWQRFWENEQLQSTNSISEFPFRWLGVAVPPSPNT